MPVPRAVAASLRRSATQLAKIPDLAVRAAATDVADVAIATGGRFGPRRRRLAAEVKVRGGKRSRTAMIRGTPAGAWTIKTYGRSAMVARTGFPIGSEFRRSARATRTPARGGRQTWTAVARYASTRVPELIAADVGEAIR